MPAYLKPLARICDDAYCSKKATVELFNARNEHLAYYCTAHGDARLAHHNQAGG